MDLSSRLVEEEQPETRVPRSADDVRNPHDNPRVARRRRVRLQRCVAALLLVLSLLAVPAWSLGHTLAANNTDPLSVRVVEWARNHHLGGLVSYVEDSWYSDHQPPKGGTPKGGIPRAPSVIAAARPAPAVHRVVALLPRRPTSFRSSPPAAG